MKNCVVFLVAGGIVLCGGCKKNSPVTVTQPATNQTDQAATPAPPPAPAAKPKNPAPAPAAAPAAGQPKKVPMVP